MSAYYSNDETADMHFMYGSANGSALAARRLYMEKFPNRRVPSHALFQNLHQCLCESGSFKEIFGTVQSKLDQFYIRYCITMTFFILLLLKATHLQVVLLYLLSMVPKKTS
ncbi:hypothetical protein X777_07655 [Ooceraea biroi]|uniref:DUF4817 domain-containing protein n=1 Tax=Ooceraea biroi TaxID=2015173 RepID=A0A026WA36_OOCBI|nr:hypothetical protein X777_07655 [Ooceraea biroi]